MSSWNNTQRLLHWRGQDYYVAMEASLKLKEIFFGIQCEGFEEQFLKARNIAFDWRRNACLGPLVRSSPANHTRGNIQEVAARGAKVLTIAEENVA